MRRVIAVFTLVLASACGFQAVSEGKSGTTGGSTSGGTGTGTSGGTSTGTGTSGTGTSGGRHGTSSAGATTSGGGTGGFCGGVVCPTGCALSADCTACIPVSPGAGLGTACASDIDCCTGTCVNGVCGEGVVCGTANAPCAASSDCCAGFSCVTGLCTFSSAGPDAGGSCTPGTLPFLGRWGGSFAVSESGSGNAGGGGGGPDAESVVAAAATGEILFLNFASSVVMGCSMPAQIVDPHTAMLVAGTTCQDTAGGSWTFQQGVVDLGPPCAMTVSAAGTFADLTQSGNFKLTLTLAQ